MCCRRASWSDWQCDLLFVHLLFTRHTSSVTVTSRRTSVCVCLYLHDHPPLMVLPSTDSWHDSTFNNELWSRCVHFQRLSLCPINTGFSYHFTLNLSNSWCIVSFRFAVVQLFHRLHTCMRPRISGQILYDFSFRRCFRLGYHWRFQGQSLRGYMVSAAREPVTKVWGRALSGV